MASNANNNGQQGLSSSGQGTTNENRGGNNNGQQGLPSSLSQGATNENRGGNGVVARAKITKNPYASKKKSKPPPSAKNNANKTGPAQSNNSNNNGRNTGNQSSNERRKRPPGSQNVAAAPVPAVEMEAMGGSSFSQAFGSIEDTEHFRNAMADNQDTTATERAEQRAFETAATMNISDRDHHELLQPHVLSISTKQRGNGVINNIRNVPFAYSRMVPDYVFSPTSCALFLSCKYHSLHPQYIHRRIAELRTDFRLRVLLVLVDLDDNQSVLLFLNKLAVQHDLTLVLAWTEEEAARYLETYKALDGQDASLIQRKEKTNFVDQAAEFLAAGSVNKTDSASLLTQFSTVKDIIAASKDELGMVTGLGEVKVARLYDAFHKPFSSKRQRERHNTSNEEEPEGIEGGTKSDDAKEPNNTRTSGDGVDEGTSEPTQDDGAAGNSAVSPKKKV